MIRFPGVRHTAAALILVTAACGDGTTEPPPSPVPASVTVSPSASTLGALGETVPLTAIVTDQFGNQMSGQAVTWSASDAAVATVDASGLVTAVGNGTTTITARAGSASGTALITVEQAAASVVLDRDTLTFASVGDTARLIPSVADGNGRPIEAASVAWDSDKAHVATVDTAGLVTAVGDGTATITVMVGSALGQARVIVKQRATLVRIDPRSLSLFAGDTSRVAATAWDQRGNELTAPRFDWSSSDTMIATVDAEGLVRARSVGGAVISAGIGDLRDETRVWVSTDPQDHHAALTAGLPEHPFVNTPIGGTEGSTATVGTLALGLHDNEFPVIGIPDALGLSVIAAGSFLGAGRVVAFSGQDFLGSDDRATLVGHEQVDRLLANAVRWTAGDRAAPLRVLADNPRIADALEARGLVQVEVVGAGPGWGTRAWSANALDDVDVAVVQVNEWGTARLLREYVPALRAFLERGGGLVIAGSALHWSWWREHDHGPFTGNLLLQDTGISWNENSIAKIDSATRSWTSGH